MGSVKRILWLSNFCFREQASSSSGTWIEAMGLGVVAHGGHSLVNVSLTGVSHPRRTEAQGIVQWELPFRSLDKEGNPPHWMIEKLQEIERETKPDLIHVWGTERFWGLATARKWLKAPALLEMQGIPAAMVPYMTGCMRQDEIRACFGLKEMLRPRLSLPNVQRTYARGWAREQEIIKGHRFIDYESEWVRNYLEPVVTNATLFKTRMILRKQFLESTAWVRNDDSLTLFSSCGCAPNKGLHTLLRAVAMLKTRIPQIRLELTGERSKGIRKSGYCRWIEREIGRLGLVDTVHFLGQLDATQMIEAFYRAAVFVHPSFVESYSMSLAEAMAVGCPCAVSYAGAMPEVGGECVQYFPLADAGSCAGAISKLLANRDLAADLGAKARKRSLELHDISAGVARQLEIYKSVLEA